MNKMEWEAEIKYVERKGEKDKNGRNVYLEWVLYSLDMVVE